MRDIELLTNDWPNFFIRLDVMLIEPSIDLRRSNPMPRASEPFYITSN